MVKFHLLKLNSCPILQQLQIEEALLRADTRNWCILNTGSPTAIVMGISGNPALLINPERYSQGPVPLIRRFSGGGTVLIDEQTLFVTWICNTSDTAVSCCPKNILNWTESLYQPHLPAFQIRENDYVLGERKFGGNAQYLCKNRWLHHTSLLWDYDAEKMEYLLMPPKMPAYRNNRPHTDFLCKLKDHFTQKHTLHEGIEKQLKRLFHTVDVEDVREILERPHRKGTTLVEYKSAAR